MDEEDDVLIEDDDDDEEYDVIVCPDCEGEPAHMPDDCERCHNEGWTYA